ncbi:MAG: ABC transporter substrate-binding protein, partial [Parasphingopyxis sp.]
RVAPSARADWYLQFFRCAAPFPCSEAYAQALGALAEAETPRVRAIRAAEAARELESMAPFIPLLRPIRWSLVGPGIAGFASNRYASHPLAPILAARR